MKYDHLTDDQKRRIIQTRLAQLEGEHYAHTLWLARQEAIGGDEAKAAVAETKRTLKAIESAHAAESAVLAKLPKPKAPAAETRPAPRRRGPKA